MCLMWVYVCQGSESKDVTLYLSLLSGVSLGNAAFIIMLTVWARIKKLQIYYIYDFVILRGVL